MTDQRDRVTTLCHEIVGALPLVHLSFFDGIGVASEALRRINDNVLLTLSWEIDTDCIQFVTQRFSSVPMGDVAKFDIEQVAQHIEAKVQDQQYVMVITAGPPCPDFSNIRENPIRLTIRAPTVIPVGSLNTCWGSNINFANGFETFPSRRSSRTSFHIQRSGRTSSS